MSGYFDLKFSPSHTLPIFISVSNFPTNEICCRIAKVWGEQQTLLSAHVVSSLKGLSVNDVTQTWAVTSNSTLSLKHWSFSRASYSTHVVLENLLKLCNITVLFPHKKFSFPLRSSRFSVHKIQLLSQNDKKSIFWLNWFLNHQTVKYTTSLLLFLPFTPLLCEQR